MKSPFPGMDPYLERRWLDLHPELVVGSRRQLQTQLASDLIASIEERVLIEDASEGTTRRIGPDVRVVEVPAIGWEGDGGAAVAVEVDQVAEPMMVRIGPEPIAQRFIQITDLSTGGKVITVIEFVSPTNKLPGDGLVKYRRKQEECVNAGVNLVEIDLTRAGQRRLVCSQGSTGAFFDSTYQISIWRAARPDVAELYKLDLRQRLPAVRIPLRPKDADVKLKLQPLLDECYANARYDRTTDYSKPCDPPLSGEEAVWAEGLLKEAGRR